MSYGKDPVDGKHKQAYINQDECFVSEKTWRHPFLVITPTIKIKEKEDAYITVIPITSKGDSYHNEINSLQISGDMINQDKPNLLKTGSVLKIDMPTRISLKYLNSDKSDCEQATFQMGKTFNNIISEIAEKHSS